MSSPTFDRCKRWLAALAAVVFVAATDIPQSAAQDDSSDGDDAASMAPALSSGDAAELLRLTGQLSREARRMSRRAQPPPPVDVDEALRVSGRSPSRIFSWIREHIDLEPYDGSLRGPTGTLVAGSANAADQAILAMRLLEEAGHSARFVTGTLHESDARTVLDDTLGERVLVERSRNEAVSFAEQSAVGRSSTLRTLQNHIWLEVDTGEEFSPFDPVAAPTFGMTPATPSERHGELPDDYRTEFEVVLVSTLEDGRTIEHLAIDGELPELAFQSVTVGFVPDPRRPGGKFPVLRHGDREMRGEPMAVADTERLELDFEVRIGGREHGWTQTLMAGGDTGDGMFDFDHQHVSIAVAPAWTSAVKVRRLAADAADDAIDVLEEWIGAEADGDEPVDEEARRQFANRVLDGIGTALPFAFTRTLDQTTRRLAEHFGVLPMMTRPRIVTTGILRDGDEYRVDLRLVGDRLSALPRSGVPAVATTSFHGLHGVVKDRLVGEMLDTYGADHSNTVAEVFDRAMVQSVPFTTIDSDNSERLARLSIEAATRERIEQQIRQGGLTLLTPIRPVDDEGIERFAWWAVDPHDGHVEGHLADTLVASDDGPGEGGISPSQLLQTHLELIARHFAAADRATDDDREYPQLACGATDQLRRLARAVCATSQPISLPAAGRCLTDPPEPTSALLTFEDVSCTDRLAPFRCGAVHSDAISEGQLAVATSTDDLPAPLCE